MRENIKTISIASIAIIALISVGWVMASKFLDLQNQQNQIVNFLNSQIQAAQTKTTTPTTK